MIDIKNFNGRWFVASDAGVFEIIDPGGEDPWLKKIEPMEGPQPGKVSPGLDLTLRGWRAKVQPAR